MGELHLEILVDRMKREFKVEADVGAPQVAYRETITKDVEVDYTHKKQSGGAGQFARVKMKFKPLERNSGVKFLNTVVGEIFQKNTSQVSKKELTLLHKMVSLLDTTLLISKLKFMTEPIMT